jgi:pimeloyl-ACP methyl ester carboxylesterase
MGEHVRAGDLDIWTEQVGQGPDVLLIGGLGDTVESWQFQLDGLADRYRLTTFDNRGAAAPPCRPDRFRWSRWPTTRPGSWRRSTSRPPT